MGYIDLHCDTLSALIQGNVGDDLRQNHLCIDLNGMKQARTYAQFFACFVYVRENHPEAWETAYGRVQEMISKMKQEEGEQLQIARSCEEIQKHGEKGIISAILTVEEGGVLNGKIDRLEALYDQGIRLMTLTWNFENCLGFPNSRDRTVMERGLKPFGRIIIGKMNELGMLIDVSHLSDGGFWDCVELSNAPIVASHSNARSLCSHPRNLSDEMLKALAGKGGVAGLNFYPAFLKESGKVCLADIARHAAHMIHVAGEDVVAIGTDFDGYEAETDENYISYVGEMEKVWDAMKKEGITERQIDKIQSQNALRVIREVL